MAASSGGTLPEEQVRAMFDRIARVYDLMNSVMTVGLHHRWRERAADLAEVGAGDRALFWPVTRNFIAAHQSALEVFKEHAANAKVGITLSVTDFQAADAESQELRDRVHHRMVQVYYDALRTGVVKGPSIEEEIPGLAGSSDFVGVQYYSRSVLRERRMVPPPPGPVRRRCRSRKGPSVSQS